jgi:hypothetical protein
MRGAAKVCLSFVKKRAGAAFPYFRDRSWQNQKRAKSAMNDGCQQDGLDNSAASMSRHPARCDWEILADLQLGSTPFRLGEH